MRRLILFAFSILLSFIGASCVHADELRFQEIAKKMISGHPDIQAQESRVRAAREVLRVKYLSLLPSVSLTASESESQSAAGAKSQNIEAVANLNLLRFGADLSGIKAADSEVELQLAKLRQTELAVEFEILNSIFESIETHEILKVNSDGVTRSETTLSIARARYEKGLLPIQEVEKAQLDLNNSQARLADARIRTEKTDEMVAKWMGSDTTTIVFQWPWKSLVQTESGMWPADLSIKNRPDLSAARLQVDIDSRKSDQAFRSIFPSLDFTYKQGRYDLAGSNYSGWGTAIVLTIPLFTGGRDYGQVNIQSEAVLRSRLTLVQLEKEAELNVQTSKKTYILARESALSREKSLKIAERLLDANRKRFEAGRAAVNELSIDYGRVFDSEVLNSQGWLGAHLALLKFNLARGKSCLSQ